MPQGLGHCGVPDKAALSPLCPLVGCHQHREDTPGTLCAIWKGSGSGNGVGMFTQKCGGKSWGVPLVLPWAWEGTKSSCSVPRPSPKHRERVAGPLSSPGHTNCHGQRWERRGWQRGGSSWGDVSLSRMRKPLPLPLSCRVCCQRHGDGSAGTELLCHLSGAAVSGSRREQA